MLDRFNKILVLGPHTDDGEFGCGGTIARLIALGKEVHYAVFSWCEESVPKELPKDILKQELKDAASSLGIPDERLHLFDYKVRRFNERRQDILEDLVMLRKKINPDLVLTPSTKDIHQDHNTVSVESVRAFKNTNILGYELVWNNISMDNACFVPLDLEHLSNKINAIQCYKSQNFRNYSDPEFLTSLAKVRGIQVNKTYAEMYEVIRLILN